MTNQNLNQIEEATKANNASILIVDDTIYNIQLLSLMLNKQGYKVEKATSGTEALESAKQLLPDIILLDIRMPDIDGYEVCKRLKADPVTKDIPIIFISSIEEPTDKVEAFSVGGVDYISKPFQLIEVLARIETHLRLCLLQKKLQEQNEELQSSAIVLSRSLEQERKLSQMKSDFISVVSHEFRTPLTTILGASELLEYYEWTKEEQVQQLHQIQSEVKHMTDLMEDVLFLSRANASRAKLHLTKFDLVDFCKRILVQMKKTFAQNYTLNSSLHIFLHGLPSDIVVKNFHLQNELPVEIVNMDEKLLRQIITNLIANAIKYSHKNSMIEFRVTVNSNVSSPNVRFVISDRGIGIPEEDLEHLFSAFHRGKNVGILPGTGLGLSIVKNCIDIHNGLISVNSKLNFATEFIVTLPLGSKN